MPQSVVSHENAHLYARQPRTEEGRRLSNALLQLRHAENVQTERMLRAAELSSTDMYALRYLVQAERDGRKMSPKDLIVMLNTSSATVTNVIERLVSRGYLTREQHPSDRRAHYLIPTPQATRHVDESLTPHHSAIVAAIDELDPDQASAAADAIDRIVGALDTLASQ
jgi:DNA-binding MarR family transcriptional regulator